jgi:hypothetical protein
MVLTCFEGLDLVIGHFGCRMGRLQYLYQYCFPMTSSGPHLALALALAIVVVLLSAG